MSKSTKSSKKSTGNAQRKRYGNPARSHKVKAGMRDTVRQQAMQQIDRLLNCLTSEFPYHFHYTVVEKSERTNLPVLVGAPEDLSGSFYGFVLRGDDGKFGIKLYLHGAGDIPQESVESDESVHSVGVPVEAMAAAVAVAKSGLTADFAGWNTTRGTVAHRRFAGNDSVGEWFGCVSSEAMLWEMLPKGWDDTILVRLMRGEAHVAVKNPDGYNVCDHPEIVEWIATVTHSLFQEYFADAE